jgi:hypothetical protein
LIHPFRNLQAGKGRLAQAHPFAGSQICNAGDVAIGSESAQTRFERIQKAKSGLRGLRTIRIIIGGDADLEVGRHCSVVEVVDLSHGNSFPLWQP